MLSARSSTTQSLTPSFSYSRDRRAPCTKTCETFASVLAYSPSLPNATTRCHSVRLCHSPCSFFHDLSVCEWRRCILPLRKFTFYPSELVASSLQARLDEPAARPMGRAYPLHARLASRRLVAVVAEAIS